MSYRINIKNAKWFPLSANTDSTYTLGDAVPLPGLRETDVVLQTANGELYGDGALAHVDSRVTGITVKIGINKIPLEARAAMQGSTVTTGVLMGGANDVPPEGAFYCENELTESGKEQLWILCCKAEPIGLAGKQREGSINYSTDELSLRGVPRKLDKLIYELGDSDSESMTSTVATALASAPLTASE